MTNPKTVRELVKNKTVAGKVTECEKILGDLSRVYRIADTFDRDSDLVELIATNGILDYVKEGGHNSEQIDAFIRGVGYMGKFMSECAKERKIIENQKKI